MFSNYASTTRTHPDPALRERRYQNTVDDVLEAIRSAVSTLARWRFISYDKENQTVALEHDTPVITFTDDVTITIRQRNNEAIVSGYSKSRSGKWDLGVNAANLRELLRVLDTQLHRIENAPS